MHRVGHYSVHEIVKCQKHASVGTVSGGRAEGKEGEGLHHGHIRSPRDCELVFVVADFRGDVVVWDTGGGGGTDCRILIWDCMIDRVFMIPVLIPFRFHFISGSRIFGSSIHYDSVCYCIGGWLAKANHPLSKLPPWLHSLHTTVKYSASMYDISKISTSWTLTSVIQIIFKFSVPNNSVLL